MNEHASFGILHTATLEADFTWWSTGINPSTRLLYHSTRQQLYNWRLQRRSPFPYAKLASLTQQTAERHYFQTKVSLQSLESKNYNQVWEFALWIISVHGKKWSTQPAAFGILGRTSLTKHLHTVQTNIKAVTIQWAMHFLVFYTWQEDLKMETKVAD